MASLLERMNIDSTGSVGPVRNKSSRGGASPYTRSPRMPKGDVNDTWQHDMYATHNSLGARLGNKERPPKMNLSAAERALAEATGEKGIAIKGASSRGNVVEVSGLADGTTSEDVEAIFKRCGHITKHLMHSQRPVVVRLVFKNEKDAQAAVSKFNGQPADGRTLAVKIVGGSNATLAGRLSVAALDDIDSVDVLMDGGASGGSKLRSDEILAKDSRATVLVAPPGADPRDYTPNAPRGRGRGRGRGGRRRGGGGGGARMDIDS
ncbi:RNA-binding protein [Phanerochaete sordida]|uniref:RNA-binding protein n=1 Tax=Phanerochaete sordida TaxID=48140 RepID=A0A9P3GCR0_9APHY|nr:RNA-binding protein [Phanerochaete sordida]